MNLFVTLLVALSALTGTDNRTDFPNVGGGTGFTFNWKYASSSQIQVYKAGVIQNSGYVVNPVGAKGADGLYTSGTVVFTPAVAAGVAVRVQRTLPLTQTSVWTPYSAFKAKTLEGQLDSLAMKDQQLQREIDDIVVGFPCESDGTCSVGLTAPTFTGGLVGNADTATTAGLHGNRTYDFDSLGAQTCTSAADITVTGAVTGSPCAVGSSGIWASGVAIFCQASATNTVKVWACNYSAAPIDLVSQTYRVVVFNP